MIWADNMISARKLARDSNKNILLFFTGKWCAPCRIMKREVFADNDVMDAINSQVVPVIINVDDPNAEELVKQYKVGATPATIFTDPEGKVIDYAVGKIGKIKFLEMLEKLDIPINLVAVLDTIWRTEQRPITLRDSLMKVLGAESKEVQIQQEIYEKNHIVNESKVKDILDKYGWPTKEMIGPQGNWTICNVLQHSDNEIRIKYLPMMRKAVKDKKLEPRFLVRAEDRIATENRELQIYGGQMKYYPETKSFNVWPVYDPENIDKRRAEIGLQPIAEFLKTRFDFEWNLDEQIQRSKEFERNMQ